MIQYVKDPQNGMKDDEKISVVFSYIQGTKVDNWVQNFFDKFYNEDHEDDMVWKCMFATVSQKIKERFVDLNLKQHAQIQIDALVQGSD